MPIVKGSQAKLRRTNHVMALSLSRNSTGSHYSCHSTESTEAQSTRHTSRRPFYRPPGNPVLVGSYTFGRVQSGIPTHRYGGPAVKSWFRIAISRRSRVQNRGALVTNSMISRPVTAYTAYTQGRLSWTHGSRYIGPVNAKGYGENPSMLSVHGPLAHFSARCIFNNPHVSPPA